MWYKSKTLIPLLGYVPIIIGLVYLPDCVIFIESIAIAFSSCAYTLADPADMLSRAKDTFLLGPVVGLVDFGIFGGNFFAWLAVGIGMYWLAGLASLLSGLVYEGVVSSGISGV